jgi:hypothetical protein
MSQPRYRKILDYFKKPKPTTSSQASAESPGRVETVLASVALFVLRLMRSKAPLDHVRLEWFCTCGMQMYADYPDSGDMAEFQKSLGCTQKRHPSFTHIIGLDGRLVLLAMVELARKSWLATFALSFTLALIECIVSALSGDCPRAFAFLGPLILGLSILGLLMACSLVAGVVLMVMGPLQAGKLPTLS